MPIAPAPLRLYQWGPESTAGTAVAATGRMAVEELEFEPADVVVRPRIANGLMLENPGNELVVMRLTRWTGRGPVVYDDLHRWGSMIVGTPVTTGAGPFTHTATRNPATVPALKSWTLQRRVTDGSNHIDHRFPYALGTSLKVSGAENEPARFEAQGFARRIEDSAITAGQSLPTIEIPPIALSKVWIDSTFAGLGTTQVVGQVLDWSYEIRSGAMPKSTTEGRANLDYSLHVFNGREVGVAVEATLLVKADSGQWATEKAAAEAQTLRAVRIQALGSASKEMTFDALCKHGAGSLFTMDESDGQAVVKLRLVTSSDLTNAFVLKTVNAQSGL